MRRVQTSEDEHKLLKEYLRTSPLVSIRARCQAILMREKKISLSDIGDIVSRKVLEKFLEQYPDKKICIIWDNASFHKGKKIREALGKGKSLERIHLIALPPYAPDKNPTEHIWNEAKGSIANIQFESFDETRAAFLKRKLALKERKRQQLQKSRERKALAKQKAALKRENKRIEKLALARKLALKKAQVKDRKKRQKTKLTTQGVKKVHRENIEEG